jgi:methyl-accepting chemotaxis protein
MAESPATKQDLQDVKASVEDVRASVEDVKASMERVKTSVEDVKASMEHSIQDLKAALEKVETTLLSEFWKWARANDVKVRSLTSRSGDLDERLLLLEERVFELERRRKAS